MLNQNFMFQPGMEEELVKPYTDKIKKLEEEIHQKDLEITRLKLEIFQYKNNSNINQPFPNINNNQFFNPMNQMQNMNMMNQFGNQMFSPMNNMNNQMFGLNQNNMINNNNLNTQPISHDNKKRNENKRLTLIFRGFDDKNFSSSIEIQVVFNDLMEHAITMFCNKSMLDKKDYIFLYNGRKVRTDFTIKENGIFSDRADILLIKNNSDNNDKYDEIDDTYKNKEKFSIIFVKSFNNTKVFGDDNDTFKDVVINFCEENDISEKKLKNLKFLYNGRILDIENSKTLKQIFGQMTNIRISVIEPTEIIGA